MFQINDKVFDEFSIIFNFDICLQRSVDIVNFILRINKFQTVICIKQQNYLFFIPFTLIHLILDKPSGLQAFFVFSNQSIPSSFSPYIFLSSCMIHSIGWLPSTPNLMVISMKISDLTSAWAQARKIYRLGVELSKHL